MRRLDWIFGFALFVVFAAVALLGLFFWQQARLDMALTVSERNQPAESPANLGESELEGETAILSLGQAQRETAPSQGTQQLLSASATWPTGTQVSDLRTGKANWIFTFYTPENQVATAVAVVDNQATVVERYRLTEELSPISIGAWRINSDDAVDIFITNGGEQFVTNEPEVTFSMNLSTVTENDRLEWLVIALAGNGRSRTMWLDATTGEILDLQTAP